MATLTIVKSDGFVAIDGVGFLSIDCSSLASNVHAVQFDGTNGHVEYTDDTANLAITSVSSYSTITDLWNTAKAASDKAESDRVTAAEAANAKESDYDWKRVNDSTTKYASIGEQLDQQYHDLVNSTTTWKDGIAAVKAAHPKP